MTDVHTELFEQVGELYREVERVCGERIWRERIACPFCGGKVERGALITIHLPAAHLSADECLYVQVDYLELLAGKEYPLDLESSRARLHSAILRKLGAERLETAGASVRRKIARKALPNWPEEWLERTEIAGLPGSLRCWMYLNLPKGGVTRSTVILVPFTHHVWRTKEEHCPLPNCKHRCNVGSEIIEHLVRKHSLTPALLTALLEDWKPEWITKFGGRGSQGDA